MYLRVRAVGVFKSFTSGEEWTVDSILAFDAAAAANREAIRIALGVRNTDQTFQTPTARTVVVRCAGPVPDATIAPAVAAPWISEYLLGRRHMSKSATDGRLPI